VDFDEAVVGSETCVPNLEPIEAEGKIADHGKAGIVGAESAVELYGVVRNIDRSLYRRCVWAGDFEAKFSGIALRQEGKREEEESEVEK
jgi:hypothetical protein